MKLKTDSYIIFTQNYRKYKILINLIKEIEKREEITPKKNVFWIILKKIKTLYKIGGVHYEKNRRTNFD